MIVVLRGFEGGVPLVRLGSGREAGGGLEQKKGAPKSPQMANLII